MQPDAFNPHCNTVHVFDENVHHERRDVADPCSLVTVFLLCGSCAVMTCAWYLHLKFKHWSMRQAIVYSWCIASLEYCLMIPANRIGALQAGMSPATLRGIAEMAILTSFLLFNRLVLKQAVLWNHLVGFSVVFIGVIVVLAEPPYSWQLECKAEAVPDSLELFRRAFPPDTDGGKWASIYLTKQYCTLTLTLTLTSAPAPALA